MRTLDDIIPPSKRAQSSESSFATPPEAPSRPRRFPLGTLLFVLLIIAASMGTLFYFSSAIVHVTPLSRTASVTAAEVTATTGGDELPFEILTVEKVKSQTVASSGTKASSASAEGAITIYNSQSTTQRLITNTRFQTTGGLIFKVRASVSIPPAKGGVPGSTTVTVYAEKPGSEYNVGPTSFTLPGLAGSPQFTVVTAKSTAAMSGGSSGNEPIVAKETEQATRTGLMDSLRTELSSALVAQVPEGYTLISGATEISFSPMPTSVATSAGMADLKEQGRVRGIILPTVALAKAIARHVLGGEYKGESVTFGSTESLILKPSASFPSAGDQSFTFTISGSVLLISTIDSSRIAAAVAGKGRSEAEAVLRQYPEVKYAVLILRPFWRTSFPEDPSSISVEVGEVTAH